MLEITIPEQDCWDDAKQEFFKTKEQSLQLEHSLVSLSKWESKWRKPFLGKERKTIEETIDYIRCMTITQNVNQDIYLRIPAEIINIITKYIEAPMTATWFREDDNQPGGIKRSKILTAEIFYYWMIAHNIPMECQKWHLNRLLTLIRVCNIESQPPPKKGKGRTNVINPSTLQKRDELNQARRKQFNSKG